jgi:hypothetical protein
VASAGLVSAFRGLRQRGAHHRIEKAARRLRPPGALVPQVAFVTCPESVSSNGAKWVRAQRMVWFVCVCVCVSVFCPSGADGRRRRPKPGAKHHFLRHLYINVIFLPREARDKHRENSLSRPQTRRFRLSFPARASCTSRAWKSRAGWCTCSVQC